MKDVKKEKEKELEFYQAYNRVIAEVNRGGMVCQKLVKQLNAEHPTLKMCLLRAIVKSVNEVDIRYDEHGKVTWHDGRIGKSVVEFCARGTVPFI